MNLWQLKHHYEGVLGRNMRYLHNKQEMDTDKLSGRIERSQKAGLDVAKE